MNHLIISWCPDDTFRKLEITHLGEILSGRSTISREPIERKCGSSRDLPVAILTVAAGSSRTRERFGKVPRRLENSRTLLLLSPSCSDRSRSSHARTPMCCHVSLLLYTLPSTSSLGSKRESKREKEKSNSQKRKRQIIKERDGRCEFEEREEPEPAAIYLSNTISRRHGTALRERLRGARYARLTRVDEERQGGGWHVGENENIAKPARATEREGRERERERESR